MLATFDIAAVRRFADDLNERLRRCDNGEGTMCANLDQMINHYVQLCGELRQGINNWARTVFTGRIEFASDVEQVLKTEAHFVLHRAKQVAAQAPLDGECFELGGLNALHRHIADLDYLLENWASPRRSVSPAPRMKMPTAVEQMVAERLSQLPALPRDWKPTEPEQLSCFETQRGE